MKSIPSDGLRTQYKDLKRIMDARNFTFMFYGFTAAWVIVLLYVVSLARRGARLKQELDDVKRLAGSAESGQSMPVETR